MGTGAGRAWLGTMEDPPGLGCCASALGLPAPSLDPRSLKHAAGPQRSWPSRGGADTKVELPSPASPALLQNK